MPAQSPSRVEGDPNIGELDDAVTLKAFGRVPVDFAKTQTV
jgi:hypothetical protein